jgi:dipeptidyl aminopeptidase/acylaminoacyl peptidase
VKPLALAVLALATCGSAAAADHQAGCPFVPPAVVDDARAASGTHAGARIDVLSFHYRAHSGVRRIAFVLVPRGRRRHAEQIPLVISPHGRGVGGRVNARRWGALPALGNFAVVSPDGSGRRLRNFSWGYGGQIDDLARMPELVSRRFPWLHVDRTRIYAFGTSMGAQETLLLVARHPHLLAGAAAFDPIADLGHRYRELPRLRCNARCLHGWGRPLGASLQKLMRLEVGGTPRDAPRAYARRSPLAQVQRIADAGIPVELWWSPQDRVVNPEYHSKRLFRALKRRNAPVAAFVGRWQHARDMHERSLLPLALATLGLLPVDFDFQTAQLYYEPPPICR